MKILKSLVLYLVICGVISAIVYYFTESLVYSAFIWVIYGAALITGNIMELILSKLISPLHGSALASIFVYLTVVLLVSGIDYYFMVPEIQQAVEYPLPLSFSIPLWIVFGILLVFHLITYYVRYRSCPGCRDITLRKGGYCHLCGFSQEINGKDAAGTAVLQGHLETSAALEDSGQAGEGRELPG